MADQLNMGNLSLGDNQNGRPAYIPPHMRGKMGGGPGPAGPPGPPPGPGPQGHAGPPPDMNGGLNNSAWNKYAHPTLTMPSLSNSFEM